MFKQQKLFLNRHLIPLSLYIQCNTPMALIGITLSNDCRPCRYTFKRQLLCQKQLSRTRLNNDSPQMLWYVITYPRPRYLFWHTSPVIEMSPYKQQPWWQTVATSNRGTAYWPWIFTMMQLYISMLVSSFSHGWPGSYCSVLYYYSHKIVSCALIYLPISIQIGSRLESGMFKPISSASFVFCAPWYKQLSK